MKVIYNSILPFRGLHGDKPIRGHLRQEGVQAIKPGDAEPRGDTHGADEGDALRGLLSLVCN